MSVCVWFHFMFFVLQMAQNKKLYIQYIIVCKKYIKSMLVQFSELNVKLVCFCFIPMDIDWTLVVLSGQGEMLLHPSDDRLSKLCVFFIFLFVL